MPSAAVQFCLMIRCCSSSVISIKCCRQHPPQLWQLQFWMIGSWSGGRDIENREWEIKLRTGYSSVPSRGAAFRVLGRTLFGSLKNEGMIGVAVGHAKGNFSVEDVSQQFAAN